MRDGPEERAMHQWMGPKTRKIIIDNFEIKGVFIRSYTGESELEERWTCQMQKIILDGRFQEIGNFELEMSKSIDH